jgi:hypothetical protein
VVVHRLSQSKKGALESFVVKFCKEFVLRGTFPNHKETIDFCVDAGVVKRFGNRIQLTAIGERLYSLNPEHKYELNNSQKDFFVKECLLSGDFASKTNQLLTQFVASYSSKTYQWSPSDNLPLRGDPEFLDLIQQSGMVRNVGGVLSVDQTYVSFVRDLRKPTGFVSPDELISRLKYAEEIGAIAEDIAFEFERQRLREAGLLLESECVQKISELDVAAGYDIRSFDGESPKIIHDKFIEVKGSTGKEIDFYWSRNEIEQARVLGRKYWLYFVGEIDRVKKVSMDQPILIRDPYKNIFKGTRFSIECEQMTVREK